MHSTIFPSAMGKMLRQAGLLNHGIASGQGEGKPVRIHLKTQLVSHLARKRLVNTKISCLEG